MPQFADRWSDEQRHKLTVKSSRRISHTHTHAGPEGSGFSCCQKQVRLKPCACSCFPLEQKEKKILDERMFDIWLPCDQVCDEMRDRRDGRRLARGDHKSVSDDDVTCLFLPVCLTIYHLIVARRRTACSCLLSLCVSSCLTSWSGFTSLRFFPLHVIMIRRAGATAKNDSGIRSVLKFFE